MSKAVAKRGPGRPAGSKSKDTVKVSRKSVDRRHENPGRPFLYTPAQQMAIAKLAKKVGARQAHAILTAGGKNKKLSGLRPKGFDGPISISYLTITKYVRNQLGEGTLPRGRREVAVA